MRRWFCVAAVMLHAAAAQTILDPAAVPDLPPAAQAVYAGFLLANLPRAAAVAANGHLGWATADTQAQADADALDGCRGRGGDDCRLYARGLDVVWPGQEQHAPPPPGPLVSTANYSFTPDARYFWRGPANAAGVYVWLHGNAGYDADLAGLQPQEHVRAFNNAGFDVVRFDRRPGVDLPARAAGWLRDELPVLRQSGYRRIVVGGQSRGGWTALQILDTAGLADAVIAVSPAAQGRGGSSNLPSQDDELRRLVADAAPAATRVAFVQFAADPFAGDLATRVALIERLRGRVGALLVIDQPPGFTGHYGADTAAFAPIYAACLLQFVLGTPPPPACPP